MSNSFTCFLFIFFFTLIWALGSPHDPDLFVVLGLQRSGTNLLRAYVKKTMNARPWSPYYDSIEGSIVRDYCFECLRATNLSTNCLSLEELKSGMVAVRGSPASTHFLVHEKKFNPENHLRKNCNVRPLTYNITGTKDLDDLLGAKLVYIVAVKDPLAWFFSVTHFWKIDCWDLKRGKCFSLLSLWNAYYGKWLDLIKANTKAVTIIRYEDVLENSSAVLAAIANKQKWHIRTDQDLNRVKVNMSLGHDFKSSQLFYKKREFLDARRYTSFDASNRNAWLNQNYEILRLFFERHYSARNLGYDMSYISKDFFNEM